jgi:hypothetical protein
MLVRPLPHANNFMLLCICCACLVLRWHNSVYLQSGGHAGLCVAGNLNVSLHFEQDFRSGEQQRATL